jgi:hypothetical protein
VLRESFVAAVLREARARLLERMKAAETDEMHKRAGGKGLVLPMLSGQADELSVSKVFRDHLEAAGVTRADLFAASQTQIRIRLRSLRDIGITRRLWRGDKPFVVQRNAGHKRFSTTEKYIADVEKLSADCGVPFPFIASKSRLRKVAPLSKRLEPLTKVQRPQRESLTGARSLRSAAVTGDRCLAQSPSGSSSGVPTWMNLEPRSSSWRWLRSGRSLLATHTRLGGSSLVLGV